MPPLTSPYKKSRTTKCDDNQTHPFSLPGHAEEKKIKVYRETGRKMIGVVQIHACISCRSQNVRKHERCEEIKKEVKKQEV
jgi:hypothetical protein